MLLGIGRVFVEFAGKLGQSLGAIGAISRWDLDDVASEVRSISLEAEARGYEDLADRLDVIERSIREFSSILIEEKTYATRVIGEFEDSLEAEGVPIARATELEVAQEHVSFLTAGLTDELLLNAVEDQDELEDALDKALEAMFDLEIRLVLHDEDEVEVEATPYDWDPEGDFGPDKGEIEFEQGPNVISYDEFVDEWIGPNGDPDDVIDRISSRTMELRTALDLLSAEIPLSVGTDVETAITRTYDAAEELEELLLG